MAKKTSLNTHTHKPSHKTRLEQPVHNLIGYGVLLLLSLVVLIIVYSLQFYIIPYS